MTDLMGTAARGGLVALCRAMLSLRAIGLPEPTGRPRIYIANHVSHADFVAIWSALPKGPRLKTRPVAGADYWLATPLRRWLITHVLRGVLVQRGQSANDPRTTGDGAADARSAAERAAERAEVIASFAAPLRAGEDLIFFPEGTRNLTDAALLPLRTGIYHLCRAVPEAEVVPLWITHMDRILPKGAYLPVPLNCTLSYGAPLQLGPDESAADFLARLQTALLACRGVQP